MARYTERSLGRQLAFQFLFSLEFINTPWEHALGEFWKMHPAALTDDACTTEEIPVIKRAFAQKADPVKAKTYAETLITGVCESHSDLNAYITRQLDNWKPERVGRIEWVLMRLALYEMLHCSEVPNNVIISEAVQLANSFANPESPRFVNGLLNKLANSVNKEEPDTPDPDAP